MADKEKIIVVYGPSYSLSEDDNRYFRLYLLGNKLAENGYCLVTGGAAGLLDAVCTGYYDYEGKKSQAYFLDCAGIEKCNLSVAYHTVIPGGLEPRFNALLEAGDAFICLPPKKSLGTLHEFATTLAMMKLGLNKPAPFILYNCLEDFRPIAEYLLNSKDFYKIIWCIHEQEIMQCLNSFFKN